VENLLETDPGIPLVIDISARKRTKQEKTDESGLGTGLVGTNCDGDFSATLEMTRGTASATLEMTR
jgi:hypothetical protein